LRPASPVRYVADIVLGLARGQSVIDRHTMEFLEYLLEMNSSRVQSDLMDRVEESQAQLEAEIRKLPGGNAYRNGRPETRPRGEKAWRRGCGGEPPKNRCSRQSHSCSARKLKGA